MFIWPEAQTEFEPGIRAPENHESAWYFVFRGNEILLQEGDDGNWMPVAEAPDGDLHFMGRLGDTACFAAETSQSDATFGGLRSLFGKTDHLMFSLAGRALQIIEWYRTHRYCGKCGQPTREHERDRAMVCDACRIHLYPRLSPSIIVLVHKDHEVLLARNHRFP
ncbi:MAG: NADH pyrophosphatase, partial [Pseudomonadales bacterium]|nr:NADH pyrophosphatase [Pseudomonadales bacterium]